MNGISIKSYAKINLSLDVLGINDDGYHEVSMVMQQIALHDDVLVRFIPYTERKANDLAENTDIDSIAIELSANRPYLPRDEKNIAYKAAMIMAERYAKRDDLLGGKVRIDIKKRIPVAAGLAGGSGNAAAVILALNTLWSLGLPMSEMLKIGAELGADVPFCIMGQAAANKALDRYVRESNLATCAALAEGTGTRLTPIPSLNAEILLIKPNFSVSTKEVYMGVDEEIEKAAEAGTLVRPDNTDLVVGLKEKDRDKVIGNMVNLLELYTIKKHGQIREIKELLASETEADAVLMSGSGPTVYAVFFNKAAAKEGHRKVKHICREIHLTRTIC